MADKKAAAPATPTSAERVKASSDNNRKEQDKASAIQRQERAAEASLNAAKGAALLERPRKVKADPDGDIDQRMAALLADHIAMGARKG